MYNGSKKSRVEGATMLKNVHICHLPFSLLSNVFNFIQFLILLAIYYVANILLSPVFLYTASNRYTSRYPVVGWESELNSETHPTSPRSSRVIPYIIFQVAYAPYRHRLQRCCTLITSKRLGKYDGWIAESRHRNPRKELALRKRNTLLLTTSAAA